VCIYIYEHIYVCIYIYEYIIHRCVFTYMSIYLTGVYIHI
jgi:hypothetical protein